MSELVSKSELGVCQQTAEPPTFSFLDALQVGLAVSVCTGPPVCAGEGTSPGSCSVNCHGVFQPSSSLFIETNYTDQFQSRGFVLFFFFKDYHLYQ